MAKEKVEIPEEEQNTPTEGEQTDATTSPEETPEDAPEDMEPDEVAEEEDVLMAGSIETTSEAEVEEDGKALREPGMTDPYPTVQNPDEWNGPSMAEYRQLKAGIRFLVSRLGGHVVAEFKEAFPLLRE